jgi:tetratricopeptide (TPR) repeat protein
MEGVGHMTGSTSERGGKLRRLLGAKRGPVPVATPAARSDSFAAYQEGRYGDAEKLLRAALMRIERREADATAHARLLAELADLYRVQARYEEAEPLYERAIALAGRSGAHPAPDLARALNGLALLHRAQGAYDRAEPLCREALAIAERTHGAEHPGTAAPLSNLLTVYLAQGRLGEADPLFRRSLALKERLLGPKHPALASSFSNYAAFLRKTRSESEAAAWEARANAIRELGRRKK